MYSFEKKKKNFCGQTPGYELSSEWHVYEWAYVYVVDDCECIECCATTKVNITYPFGLVTIQDGTRTVK